MASHSEIKVGDTDWVVRVQGEDVRVKVMEKVKKASGRGYDFKLRRVGPDGRVFGRSMTRGSGALRRQGDPVKAFGGKAARTAGSKARPKPPVKKVTKKPSTPKVRENRPVTAPALPSFSPTPAAPSLPAPLESLRGRGRSPRTSSAKASAPARTPSGKDTIQVRVGTELVKKVVRRLEKIPASTPDYMLSSVVRNAVAEVLADHERNRFNAGFAYRR